MTDDPMKSDKLPAADIFVAEGAAGQQVPIWTVAKDASLEALPLSAEQRAWAEAVGFKGTAKQQTLLPGPDGRVAGVLFGLGDGAAGEPSGPSELLIGQLAQSLPSGSYRLASEAGNPTLAAIAWGLGSYRYARYKSSTPPRTVSLRLPEGADRSLATSTIEAVLARPRPHQHTRVRPRPGRDRDGGP